MAARMGTKRRAPVLGPPYWPRKGKKSIGSRGAEGADSGGTGAWVGLLMLMGNVRKKDGGMFATCLMEIGCKWKKNVKEIAEGVVV